MNNWYDSLVYTIFFFFGFNHKDYAKSIILFTAKE